NGRAEELTLIVGHLQEPARPAPRIAADLGIGQVAHDCQHLLAGGRPVRQFNPFFVRQDAVAEVEMEEIKRHMTFWIIPLVKTPPRDQFGIPKGFVCSTLDPGTDKVPNFKMQVPYKSLPWVSVKPSQEIGVCGLWSPSNSRMSAAKYSGTGAHAASANSARSPAANACANFI